MSYRVAADTVLLLHFAFILFIVAGGLLVLRWPKLMWLHLPAAGWGAMIEFAGWICPLTPLENRLRLAGGDTGLTEGFINEYLFSLVYPAGLTRGIQLVLGAVVIAVNVAIYGALLLRRSRLRRKKI